METKTLQTRIQNKHDIEVNWNNVTDFIPMTGELIVYDVDNNYTYERFKIGDGINLPKDLPFTVNPHSHINATNDNAGLMSASDKTKLDGIDVDNLVTLDSDQLISGVKTFTSSFEVQGGLACNFSDGDGEPGRLYCNGDSAEFTMGDQAAGILVNYTGDSYDTTIYGNNIVIQGDNNTFSGDVDFSQAIVKGLPDINNAIIATFNITIADTTIDLASLEGITQIDWGDGVVDTKSSHTYATAGIYKCKIYEVTSINSTAFYGCSSLTSVKIPNNVTSIGQSAFDGCTNLTSVVMPNSVTSISKWTFKDCRSLTSIEIPDSVISIGSYAFDTCTGLTSVIIPNSVTSIGGYAFYGCSNLTEITLPFVGATKDGTENTHFGYIFGASSDSEHSSYLPNSLKKVTITSATVINDDAFNGCNEVTAINLPDSLLIIGNRAFANCYYASINIPDSVTSIGASAFYSCGGLTSIVIPKSVTSIGDYVFDGCSELKKVTFLNEIPSQITTPYNGTWFGTIAIPTIVVPAPPDSEAVDLYKAAWPEIADYIVSETPATKEWVITYLKECFSYEHNTLTIDLS